MAGEPLIPRIGTPENPIRIAVLFSGSGTGMNALFQHQGNQSCTHKTVLSITNKSDAGGIMFANERGIPVVIETVDPILAKQERRIEQERRIMKHLEQYSVEVIILSGYMRILSEEFVSAYYPKIINIHPSLLPAFPGADAHSDVLSSQVRVSGCTVHVVDSGMDSGTILGQSRVPVFTGDSRASLAKRVQIEEHRLYPEIIDLICSGHEVVLED
ncbi:MAG: phosphoribosylglycinamide formyltransferase [Euryarchaeota archaeon]|nr:phosphoribosylglycinamide formyltransferase [Euryarchaeota archaeon]MBT5592389.1 phosphoribosylglycinamide formyltransferase [Euryarchaeota archaeon]